MNKNHKDYTQFIKSSKGLKSILMFIVFLILFSGLAVFLVVQYNQTVSKSNQLQILENELKAEKQRNDELKLQKEDVKSDTYIEKEARNKLGYSYPNENLYILKKIVDSSVSPIESNPVLSLAQENKSPIQKWMDLIFGQ
ncbi:MAG: septum formation initiator family protein [bacterium]